MRKKRKRGRPPKYVSDERGRPLVGLSCDDNGFYNTHYRTEGVPRLHFGAPDDYINALRRFRRWRDEREKKTTSIVFDQDDDKESVLNQVHQRILNNKDGWGEWRASIDCEEYIDPPVDLKINEEIGWDIARSLISNNPPSIVAEKLGIPEFAELHKLTPLPKPLTLHEIGEIYLKRTKKPLRQQEYDDSKRWWEQFCKLAKSKTVRDVCLSDIKRYQDALYELFNKHEYSPTWIKHRFDKIKTILRYALKSDAVEYTKDIEDVLVLCKKFVYPERASVDPKPIHREDFQKIFALANAKEKAILLLAANAALYPQDVCDLKKAYINLQKKTLVMDRGKTGVPRVACLWDRTVRAIERAQAEAPHDSEFLFITFLGKPYCAHGIGSIWRKLRKKAEVDHAVKFEHIRDACQTAGVDANCTLDEVRFLLGHRVAGVTDHYLKRRPNLTQKACEEIEKYFFA
ncbi:tyrosine recombinase XerC [Anaerohalosphaera lusitana]|uniref:Tyrosine recombinase XerC n=1 Tax=Anaerohalosphaera lusitana TaxID=1936003 RepID=A0A1U9NRB9_9BACT|nr:site-specific integrase [Anaerohalosphaera lusitana]AQT70076.1 tyrosine recombinase XerC [Anaerohalosphaera lusitana]